MRMAAMLHPTASITFPKIGQTLTRLRTYTLNRCGVLDILSIRSHINCL